MTLHRFYVSPEQITPSHVRILGDDAVQVRRVLRLHEGAILAVFDGSGREIQAQITEIRSSEVVAEPVSETWPQTEHHSPLILVQALLKGEKMDWVVEKATELGATEIRIFPAQRSVVQVKEERAERKIARWQRIAKEATEQCGRVQVPNVCIESSLAQALKRLETSIIWLADEEMARQEEETYSEASLEPTGKESAGNALFIGPEGGWTPTERELLIQSGARRLSLGPRILRAETAAVVGLTRLTSLG